MATPIGPAGTASQVFTVSEAPKEAKEVETTETQDSTSKAESEVPEQERVNANSNVGNNVDTTA